MLLSALRCIVYIIPHVALLLRRKISFFLCLPSRSATSQVSASLSASTTNKQQLFDAEAEQRAPCIILEIQWAWLALQLWATVWKRLLPVQRLIQVF